MGCSISLHRRKVGDGANNMSVQDEARSFRSKVEAIRFMTKNVLSRQAFQQYLEQNHGGVEYLQCFIELDEVKALNDDRLIPQVSTLLSKYQTMCEQAEALPTPDPTNNAVNLWEKLRRVRLMDVKRITRKDLISTITAVQNQVLGELAAPFEAFLDSTMYKAWQENQIKAEKEHGKPHPHPLPNRADQPIITSSGKWLASGTSNNNNNQTVSVNISGSGLSPNRPASQQDELNNLTSVLP